MLADGIKGLNILTVADSAIAGQTVVNSSIVDVGDCEGVIFICKLGTVTDTAAITLKAQCDDVDAADNMADISGASAAVASASSDSNKLILLDIIRPTERYVRAVVTRATANSAIESIIAIKYGPKVRPITEDASVVASTQKVC